MNPYIAPRWLPGGHLQTLYAALVAPYERVSYARERWETPDADFVDVDWVATSAGGAVARKGGPLVVLFHGLEGQSERPYAHALMSEVAKVGWSGAVVLFRGCSGAPNRLPRAYHSGDSAEIEWILRKFRGRHEGPLYAVGVSLGGNALLKWLGEERRAASSIVAGAAAVSAPVDLMAAGDALGSGFNLVYTRAFLSTLKRKSMAKLAQHPGIYDAKRVLGARTLRAFDNVVTAPIHGFRDTDDYWTRASSKPLLRFIEVPTLVVNARNDPFLPEQWLPEPHEVSPAVELDFPEGGGHVGFVSGPFPGNLQWLPQRILSFFSHSRTAS